MNTSVSWRPAIIIVLLLFVAGCSQQSARPSGPQAASSDFDGTVTFAIAGKATSFRFVDEQTGSPLSGLSVGFALDGEQAQGVLLVIDSEERIPPQVIVLHGEEQTPTGAAISFAEESSISILLSDRAASIIQDVTLDQLPAWSHPIGEKVETILEIVPIAAKAIDNLGIPLGRYAETLGDAKEKTYTQDEYLESINSDLQQKALKHVFFFVTGDVPDAASVSIELADYSISKGAGLGCGPTKGANRIKVVTVGMFEFVGCKSLTTAEQVDGLYRVPAEGYDERGLPLSKGSIHLISKNQIGLAYEKELSDGKAEVSVPKGDYIASVSSEGYYASEKEVKAEVGTNVKFTMTGVSAPVTTQTSEEGKASGKPETWTGTLTGTQTPVPSKDCGEFSYAYDVRFTVPSSLVAAFQSGTTDYWIWATDTSGTLSGKTGISRQSPDTSCELAAGSFDNFAIFVNAGTDPVTLKKPLINIATENFGSMFFSAASYRSYDDTYLDGHRELRSETKISQNTLTLTPTSISETSISGTWKEGGDFPPAHWDITGTFTLTKQ